jgi:hypothetical protein
MAIACMLTVALGCTGDRDHTVVRQFDQQSPFVSVLSIGRLYPSGTRVGGTSRAFRRPSPSGRPGSRDSGVRGLRPGGKLSAPVRHSGRG